MSYASLNYSFFRPLDEDEAEEIRNIRKGVVVYIVMYSRSPKKYNFFQAIVSTMMWIERGSHSLFVFLNRLGVSQGSDAARSNVDKLRTGFNKQIQEWGKNAEVQHCTVQYDVCVFVYIYIAYLPDYLST